MKTISIHLLAALVATASATAQPKPPGDRRPPPQPLLPVLDTDRDGELSEAEIATAPDSLATLDKNDDGSLTRKEYLPKPPKGKLPPKPKGPKVLVKTVDLDGNGTISAEEIDDAAVSLAILDRDSDGTISRKELKPGKPPVKSAE